MSHFALRAVGVFLLLLTHHCPLYACAWDRDTLEAEAKGIPEVMQIITGRFERNPDLFYEMRLQRVTQEIAQSPDKLELYDDAGMASDRLHRGDEAIAWMHKKQATMRNWKGDTKVLKEHRYRYLANQGTFIAHRWLRDGADRKRIGEMKQARNLIAEAIELNPDAHFGREKYQLKMMEWIIAPPEVKKNDILPSVADTFESSSSPEPKNVADAVKGLSGIIVLGDAWQSVDTFYALSSLLSEYDQRNSVAYLADLRTKELIKSGKRSILPTAPNGEALIALMDERGIPEQTIQYADKVAEKYKLLRAEANQWHTKRTAYMIERLKAGRHPDTDKDFWNEWQEPSSPSLYIQTAEDIFYVQLKWGVAIAAIAIIGLWIGLTRRHKKRKAAF